MRRPERAILTCVQVYVQKFNS